MDLCLRKECNYQGEINIDRREWDSQQTLHAKRKINIEYQIKQLFISLSVDCVVKTNRWLADAHTALMQ